MKQHINQRRIAVDGTCDEWIGRSVEALEATGFQAIDVDDMRVHAEYAEGRTRGSITIKCQSAAEKSVLHIATLACRLGRGDALGDKFVQRLLASTVGP